MNPAQRFPWSARLALTLALGVLLFAVTTIIRWTGPAVALAYAWEPGEVIRDRATVHLTMRIQPSLLAGDVEVEMALTSVTRVIDVDEQGNATLEISTEDVDVVESSLPGPQSGLTAQAQLQGPQTLVVAPDGRIVESSSALFGPPTMENQRFTTMPLLPEGPVGPGDIWEMDHVQKFGFAEGGFELHARNELLRYDEVNGVETVVVVSDVTGPIDLIVDLAALAPELPPELVPETDVDFPTGEPALEPIHYTGSLAMEGRSWVDPLTGDVLRSRGDGMTSISFSTGSAGSGAPSITMEVELEMETERLPADDARGSEG